MAGNDPFGSSRLGKLPNAGYATAREKAVSDLIMQFIRTMERDRICLLDIVCQGRAKWRKVCGRALRGARMDTELVDAVFDYLSVLAGPDPMTQLGNLLHMKAAPPWLGDNNGKQLGARDAEAKVRESLQVVEAINKGNRRADDLLVRLK